MLGFVKKIINFSIVAIFIPMGVFAAQTPNPRGNAVNNNSVVSNGTGGS